MNFKKCIFLLMILSIIFLAGCSQETSTNNQKTIYDCNTDRDCIIVKADCCGCTAGGKAVSINKDSKSYWDDQNASKCKRTGCLDVMSDDVTCNSVPKCINDVCKLIPR